MPLNSLVALGVDNAPINALGSFAEGQQAGAVAGFSKLKQTQATLETVGSAAMYALNGDPNGEVDPAKYSEVMDSLQKIGMDTSAFRDNPNFAKVAANAAVTALDRLKLAQGDRDYDMLMAKFQADLAQNATSNDFEQQKIDIARQTAGARDVPSGYQSDDQGNLTYIPGGPADPNIEINKNKRSKTLTEGQAKTAGYANRMVKAETELSGTDEAGNSIIDESDPSKASMNPLSADFWESMNRQYGPNMTQSPEYQRYLNGAAEWVRAKLRKESGAAISNSEWQTEFTTYFPQPGDDKSVVLQKARLRTNAVESMKAESRGGYKSLFEGDGNVDGAPVDPASGSDEYDIEEVSP